MLKAKSMQEEAKIIAKKTGQEQKARELLQLVKEAKAREKQEAYDAQHRQFIECDHCHKMQNDEDGKASRFRTCGEKQWFSVIDTTAWCTPCQKICIVCPYTNSFNPTRKLMFCSPLCWISHRGGIHGIKNEGKNYFALLDWCDDNLYSSSLHIKKEIKRMFEQRF